jgi:hypothetical protein
MKWRALVFVLLVIIPVLPPRDQYHVIRIMSLAPASEPHEAVDEVANACLIEPWLCQPPLAELPLEKGGQVVVPTQDASMFLP